MSVRHSSARSWRFAACALLALAVACSDEGLPTASVAEVAAPRLSGTAAPTDLIISEIIEGSSNNKAIEIYNGTGAAVDLAAGGYAVQMYFNGSASVGLTINLSGTVAAGDVYVLAQASADAAILAEADQTSGAGWFNGDDAVALVKSGTNIDVIGQIGFDPGSQWGTDLTSTADNTLRRKVDVCVGDADGSNVFDPAVEWDGFANNTFDGLGSHDGCAASAIDELFISEYVEGSSNNKAIEIYNGTNAAVDLAAGGYAVQMYFNGSTSVGLTINLTGTVAAGDVYVIAQASADAAILAEADQTSGAGWFNGDDAVVLVKDGVNLDVIGQIGFDPGSQWGADLASTADNTLRRVPAVCAGDPDGSDVFEPALEWDGYANNTFDGLGAHTVDCGGTPAPTAPAVSLTLPGDNASNVALDATLTVTFSRAVTVSGTWYTITCSVTGAQSASATGGPLEFVLTPSTAFSAGESCTATILAAQVVDAANGTPMVTDYSWSFTTASDPLACGAPFTPAFLIQGAGAASPLAGQTVTTQGVVVGDMEGSAQLGGFFLQDAAGDGDPSTSDGLFVFTANAENVNVGDVVRVTGTVTEFFNLTELTDVAAVNSCGTGSVAPTDVTLPLASATALESLEGMLVRFPQTLYVTEHFELARFGEVVVSSSARLAQPTNVVSPGAAALALQAQNDLNRLTIDDSRSGQNPDPVFFARGGNPLSAANTLRGGDRASDIVGVLTYTFGRYRLEPLGALGGGAPNFVAANARSTTAPSVGGTLKVASFNVLNYFNSFGGSSCGVGGATSDCRGANNATEFERQAAKTVSAILGLDADVVGIIEIENDGYDAASAIADLVSRLNTASGAGTYAFVDADARTAQVNALGTDAIKVGLLYKPARVSLVGQTAVLNSIAFVNGGDPAPRNRPALAQAFQQTSTGARFIATVNHFKSKGSACSVPDAGDLQGNCNAVRVAAANALRTWLATDPTGTGDPDVLIMGDLNAYAKEDPIAALQAGGFSDLLAARVGSSAYSYVFDGQWGYLDHALASSSMASQVTGVAEWHINADEPLALDYNTEFKSASQLTSFYDPSAFRASDHDPLLIGLNLVPPAPAGPVITLTPPPAWTAGQAADLGVLFSGMPARSAPYIVRIDWGDGTAATQFASTIVPRRPINRPHSYSTAGSYLITVTVRDRQGTVTTETLAVTVQP
jgi:uncharacterized protein